MHGYFCNNDKVKSLEDAILIAIPRNCMSVKVTPLMEKSEKLSGFSEGLRVRLKNFSLGSNKWYTLHIKRCTDTGYRQHFVLRKNIFALCRLHLIFYSNAIKLYEIRGIGSFIRKYIG